MCPAGTVSLLEKKSETEREKETVATSERAYRVVVITLCNTIYHVRRVGNEERGTCAVAHQLQRHSLLVVGVYVFHRGGNLLGDFIWRQQPNT